MAARSADGSAGDVDYGDIGTTYSRYRRPDPRISDQIHRALGNAAHVLNVGAGAGSYEPEDRRVTAVEPSASMRAQRPSHLSVAVDAFAEALPFANDVFDASMAIVTVHQWSDLEGGLAEMRRVTRGPVVVLTADPAQMHDIWIADYCPEVRAIEARRFPTIERVVAALGVASVAPVMIPLDCRDGFSEAYYGRPEALLDADARLACSSWSLVPPAAVEYFVETLSRDLANGRWDERYGRLRRLPTYNAGLRLIVGGAR